MLSNRDDLLRMAVSAQEHGRNHPVGGRIWEVAS